MTALRFTEPVAGERLVEQMRHDTADEAEDGDAEACAFREEAFAGTRYRPAKVAKLYYANRCLFNCAYCGCRASLEGEGAAYCLPPAELAELAMRMAVENGHGVFLPSAIRKSADETEEMLLETLKVLRGKLDYQGYVHCKVMPGTDPELIRQVARYADRMSVNIEVARAEGYEKIARQKNRTNILTPMEEVSRVIRESRGQGRRGGVRAHSQTTQIMAGALGETDSTLLRLSSALYIKYGLKRVYYTAYHYTHAARGYEGLSFTQTPVWRVRRLYQADRLMQLYGFSPEELAPEDAACLQEDMDPKAAWALRHRESFPVDVNRAPRESLLRVPGIGLVYSERILRQRHCGALTREDLERIGVRMDKALPFLTFSGRYAGGKALDRAEALRESLKDSVVKGKPR